MNGSEQQYLVVVFAPHRPVKKKKNFEDSAEISQFPMKREKNRKLSQSFQLTISDRSVDILSYILDNTISSPPPPYQCCSLFLQAIGCNQTIFIGSGEGSI